MLKQEKTARYDSSQTDLFIPEYALTVDLTDFQGPLDLLLYLIRSENMDILDIRIARITEQYLLYVNESVQKSLSPGSEYLVMIATLLNIKSRELIPIPDIAKDEEGPDPRLELQQRLLEYERYRKVAAALDENDRLERDHFLASVQPVHTQTAKRWSEVRLKSLVQCYSQLMRVVHYRQTLVAGQAMESLSSCIQRLKAMINTYRGWTSVHRIFVPNKQRSSVVWSFVALINLIHEGWLRARIDKKGLIEINRDKNVG